MENEYLEMIKLKADIAKEITLYHLLSADEEYQNSLKQLNLLEQLYDNLNLSDAQRSIINSYMNLWDHINSDYSTYSYLAGLKDGLEQDGGQNAAGQTELLKAADNLIETRRISAK